MTNDEEYDFDYHVREAQTEIEAPPMVGEAGCFDDDEPCSMNASLQQMDIALNEADVAMEGVREAREKYERLQAIKRRPAGDLFRYFERDLTVLLQEEINSREFYRGG